MIGWKDRDEEMEDSGETNSREETRGGNARENAVGVTMGECTEPKENDRTLATTFNIFCMLKDAGAKSRYMHAHAKKGRHYTCNSLGCT